MLAPLCGQGGHPPKVEQAVIDQIKALDGDFNLEVYMSLTCHNCPDVVQALSPMAILNPKVKTTVIEGGAFQDEVNACQIMAVPSTFNGQPFARAACWWEEIVAGCSTPPPPPAKLPNPAPKRRMTCSSSAVALPVPLPPCTPPAKASAWAWPPSVLAAR